MSLRLSAPNAVRVYVCVSKKRLLSCYKAPFFIIHSSLVMGSTMQLRQLHSLHLTSVVGIRWTTSVSASVLHMVRVCAHWQCELCSARLCNPTNGCTAPHTQSATWSGTHGTSDSTPW